MPSTPPLAGPRAAVSTAGRGGGAARRARRPARAAGAARPGRRAAAEARRRHAAAAARAGRPTRRPARRPMPRAPSRCASTTACAWRCAARSAGCSSSRPTRPSAWPPPRPCSAAAAPRTCRCWKRRWRARRCRASARRWSWRWPPRGWSPTTRTAKRAGRRGARRHRPHRGARAAARSPRRQPGPGRRDRRRRRRHRPAAGDPPRGGDAVPGPLARLGAAAGGARAGRDLRRDGRDQHGAWRVRHARRLHHLLVQEPAAACPGCCPGRCRCPCRPPSWSRPRPARLLERGLIRHLYGRPLETLLMTFGVGMIIQQAVRLAFGAQNREVLSPRLDAGHADCCRAASRSRRTACGSSSSASRCCWLVVAAIRFTRFGLEMRAVMQNRAHRRHHGHPHRPGGRADLRLRLRHRRHGGRGAEPDRQRLAQPRHRLHHRQLHGGGVRRRRQPGRHAGRRLRASASSTRCWSPGPARCWPRSSVLVAHHAVHPAPPARPLRAARAGPRKHERAPSPRPGAGAAPARARTVPRWVLHRRGAGCWRCCRC